MTPEQIQYVREWAKSGNRPRSIDRDQIRQLPCLSLIGPHDGALATLNSAGLTIARLADALEQANHTAEDMEHALPGWLANEGREYEPSADIATMRANRKELLG